MTSIIYVSVTSVVSGKAGGYGAPAIDAPPASPTSSDDGVTSTPTTVNEREW
jgi:hypothetical protein